MKANTALVMLAALTFCLFALTMPASGRSADETEFPYFIQAELGATEFAPGDNIVITSVRGDRQHIEVGGHYLLEGSYTLGSAESADLAWYSTSRGPSGSTPVSEDQHVKIIAGPGNFRLKKTMVDDGWLHVSFYVEGHSHGGIYFGEKGFENTILRQKGWSDFSEASSRGEAATKPTTTGGGSRQSSSLDERAVGLQGAAVGSPVSAGQANAAIMAYLGNPVSAPANLDARYWPTNLAAAFVTMANKSGWQIQKLAVDDSEFPFLVYGVIDGRHELVANDIRAMEGYDYSGSVRGSTDKGTTYFSLNMIPHAQYPAGQMAACHRRLMVRLQMLADSVKQSE